MSAGQLPLYVSISWIDFVLRATFPHFQSLDILAIIVVILTLPTRLDF